MDQVAKCELCGEPMPPGEQMFKLHGYSGPCPKPPLPRPLTAEQKLAIVEPLVKTVFGLGPSISSFADKDDPMDREFHLYFEGVNDGTENQIHDAIERLIKFAKDGA